MPHEVRCKGLQALQRLGAIEESHSPWPRYQGGTVDHSVTGILGWNVPPSGTVKVIGSSI